MQNKIWGKILLFLCSLILVHCGPSGSSSKLNKRFGRINYDVGQCSASPFEGVTLLGAFTRGPVKTLSYFNKDFYPETLVRTFPASSYSIAESLFREGIPVYQVASGAEPSCRYFDFLNLAPESSLEQWNEVNQTSSGGASLLGLFTTVYSRNTSTKKTKIKTAAIMVLDQTQKWTLLHELSHYLFAKARVKQADLKFNSEVEEQLDIEFNQIKKLKNQLKATPVLNDAQEITKLYRKFFHLQFLLDRRTALEEFTIESLLLESLPQISGIHPAEDAQQAFLYMKNNGERVLFSYVVFIDELKAMQNVFEQNGWMDEVTDLELLEGDVSYQVKQIEVRLKEANLLQKKVRGLIDPPGISLREGEEVMPHNHYNMEKFNKRHSLFTKLWDN